MFIYTDLITPISKSAKIRELIQEKRSKDYGPITAEALEREENYIVQKHNEWVKKYVEQYGEKSFILYLADGILEEQATLFERVLENAYSVFPKRKELFLVNEAEVGPENNFILTSLGAVPNFLANKLASHLNFFCMFFALNYPKKNLINTLYDEAYVKYVGLSKNGRTIVASYNTSYAFRAITADILVLKEIIFKAINKNIPIEKIHKLLKFAYQDLEKIDRKQDLFLTSIISSIVSIKQKVLEGVINEQDLEELALNMAIAINSYYSLLDIETIREFEPPNFSFLFNRDESVKEQIENKYLSYFYENIVKEDIGIDQNEFYLYAFSYAKTKQDEQNNLNQLVEEALMLDDRGTSEVPISDDMLALLVEKAGILY